MVAISNKKRKFIKKNFKHLSIEELARKTDLKPGAIRLLIDEYSAESLEKDQYSSPKPVGDKGLLAKRSMRMRGICALFIFLLTALVYTPALKNDFVWDDRIYIYENTNIQSLSCQSLHWMLTSFHAGNWHPLTWLSHAIDYAFWGLNPFGHHLTNIILHGLNASLVFLLVIRLMVKTKEFNGMPSLFKVPLSIPAPISIVSGVTALLFGLHPLHVESVAWAAERKELLCTFFFLLTLLSYLFYTSSGAQRYRWNRFTICLLLFMCALMSKPMAVTLPVILLLLDIYPLKRLGRDLPKNLSVLLEKIPFFILCTASSVITTIAQHLRGAVASIELLPISVRLLNALHSLIFYLKKMIWPIELVPFYPFPKSIYPLDPQYITSGVLILAITGSCIYMVKRGKYLFLTIWLYYVVTLLPVLGIIQVGRQAAADRYTYLPSISIFLLIGIGVLWGFKKGIFFKHKGRAGVVVLACTCILISLGLLTIKQIRIWRNPEIFWSYVISAFPSSKDSTHAYCNLADAYAKKGELDKAISEYKHALVINPRFANAHNNLGVAYCRKGMLDKAITEFNKALSIKPNYADAHNNLGTTYFNKGRLDKAISEFKHTLTIKPDYADAHYNLSIIYYHKRNFKLAKIHYNKAVELRGSVVNPKLSELLKTYR